MDCAESLHDVLKESGAALVVAVCTVVRVVLRVVVRVRVYEVVCMTCAGASLGLSLPPLSATLCHTLPPSLCIYRSLSLFLSLSRSHAPRTLSTQSRCTVTPS